MRIENSSEKRDAKNGNKNGINGLKPHPPTVGLSRLHVYPFLKKASKRMRRNPTRAEAMVWSCLKGRRLGKDFRRQHVIGKFIVDFYCPESGLIIEIDGGIHDTPEQAKKDALRERYLIQLGFRIIRFTNRQVLNDIQTVKSVIQTETESP
ncbi:endonuclease domain-containing protein [Candidatus Uhrbacteria bacterium]|nr:endonuclease domain-containing protein [Candidatus Uhrbacteria bacterium]